MECARFTDEGLLYHAGELEADKVEGYKQHIAECQWCRCEANVYKEHKMLFFGQAQLATERPSSSTDKEILRVCAAKPVLTSSFGLFSMVRKGVLAALLLAAGFAGGGYYMYVMNSASHSALAAQKASSASVAAIVPVIDKKDNFSDSMARAALSDTSLAADRPQQLGQLNESGVTTVKATNQE